MITSFHIDCNVSSVSPYNPLIPALKTLPLPNLNSVSPRCNIAVYLATISEFPTTPNVCSVIILLIALDVLLLSHDSQVVFDPIVLVSNTLLLYLFVDVVCVKMGSNACTNASVSN
eukprot:227087_1